MLAQGMCCQLYLMKRDLLCCWQCHWDAHSHAALLRSQAFNSSLLPTLTGGASHRLGPCRCMAASQVRPHSSDSRGWLMPPCRGCRRLLVSPEVTRVD